MAMRSDFRMIDFNEHLGDNAADLNVPWATFKGDKTTLKTFHIDGNPKGEAYLIIQAYNVQEYTHKILINGTPLAGVSIPKGPSEVRWQTSMDRIEPQLKPGPNKIQIERDPKTTNNFVVGKVVVQWRESD